MNVLSKARAAVAALAVAAAGCVHSPPTIPAVDHVDLQRFMGDWYVIAHIPSYPERDAYNAVESYALRDDGRIQATFRFNKGGFDEPIKAMHPVGTVRPGFGNAVWGMQFVWPIQAEYVIVYLDPDYRITIVGRSDRDYVWIMARTPTISDAEYRAALAKRASWDTPIAIFARCRSVPLPRVDGKGHACRTDRVLRAN